MAALFGGPEDWGLRRMALPYARIAREEGADGLLIGSEMRGLTWTRDAAGGFPAVDQFRTLAAVCRADGEAVFHLDPPWRPMRLHAGASTGMLTARADMAASATVGVLVEPLGPGVRNRWDEIQAVAARVEGTAPQSASEAAVLGGVNALAVQTAAGWEVVQYRTATLVAGDTWRLTGLLRGQQGTEVEMRAGAAAGAVVVFLDDALARAEIGPGERGLPLICRAGPAGAAPGGAGFSEVAFTLEGRQRRPWSPSGLTVEATAAGRRVRWTPRVRLYGDPWDGETAAVDPLRFRLRVLEGVEARRTMTVEGMDVLYAAADLAADFPDGPTPTSRIAVAQWGDGWGWGVEAEIALD